MTLRHGLMACVALGALATADVARAADAATEVSEVVITGQRQSQERAVDTKRAADNEVDVLSANDVGKLPDQNVAEAVRRLPGVSVANDQGEGRYVIIRGVDPNLALVTVNGQTAAAPEPEGRQVKLDDIPSSLISGVKVIKTLTADLDADAIAGQVDIDTLSAFDRRGPIATLNGSYGEYDINHKNPYEIDGVWGGLFGADQAFGAVLSANHSNRPIRSENVQGTSNWAGGLPDGQGYRFYNLTRERTGFVGNFDYRPNEDMKLYLRAMYSKFSDNENRDRFDVTNTGTASFVTAPTAAQFSRVRGDRLVRRREEDDNTRTLSGGGEFKLGAGTLTAEGVYSKAEKTDPLRSEFAFRSGNVTAAVPVDLSAFLYKVTAPTQLFDPSLYNFRSVNYDKREATEALTQARADYLLPVMGDSSLKFGVKYLERKKKNDRNIDNYTAGSQAFTLAPLDASSVSDIYDGRYPFGPRVIYNSAQAFVTANPNSISRVANTSLSTSLLSDYDVNEKVTAAYAMGTFKVFDKWTFIPGVRVEHTDGSYSTKSYIASTNSQGPNIEGSKDYTDVFPGINVRFNATDQLVFRGAITTAISRPGYTTNNGISGGVVPIVSVDTTTNVVTLGNADLKELHAVNFDFAMEYYLPGHGVVSLAAFDKMIDDPIYSQVSTQSGTFGGVAVTNAVVTRPVNAKSASLRGLEANWQMQFIDLPSFWNGFGVALNATMISAHADGVPTSALNAPLRDRVPLINQSNRVASFQVFYEKYGFTGRFAYSYRSRYMDGVGPDAAHDTFVADHGEADARVAYAINRNAEVFVEGSNLTNAPWRRYIGNRHQMVENEQYGPAGRVGFTIRR